MISTRKLTDDIPMLTAKDQIQDKTYPLLGIDTEMLFKADGKYVWPHLEGFEQERGKHGMDFDWHGDGYAFELCTPPVTCLEYMANKVGRGLLHVRGVLLSRDGRKEISLDAPAVYRVPNSIQKSASDNVKRLGCMPSLNVYGDAGTPSKLGESIRTTGCHLHITHNSLQKEDVALNLVQWTDIIVGNVWNYISPESPNLEALRRSAYGRAGEYRARLYPATETSYAQRGVEYRALPGSVIKNPAYLTLCFNLYRTALRFARDHGSPSEELTDLSRRAINKADKEISKVVIDWLPFPAPARKLLQILHNKPLPSFTPQQWYNKSVNHNTEGHRYLAVKERLTDNEG